MTAALPLLLLSRLEAQTQYLTTRRIEDIEYIPAHGALPALSLGYRKALADLMWISALVYFGEQISVRGQLRYLEARTDAILALDPRFRDVYEWIAIVAVYNNGSITRTDIETSNRYLERGIRMYPRDGELYYLLAFNYAVELLPWAVDEAEKNGFRRKSADLFLQAARLPGSRSDAALMAAEMAKRGGDTAVAIAHIRSLLSHVSEDRIRDQLVSRLAQLTSEEEAARADADRADLVAAWRRDFPYLPLPMFALVGERVRPATEAEGGEPPDDPDADPP